MAWLSQQALVILKRFLEDPRGELSGADLIRVSGLLSGTVYPILLRFERKGLMTSRWEEGDPHDLGRPRRRLYRLTGDGVRVALAALKDVATPAVLVPSEA